MTTTTSQNNCRWHLHGRTILLLIGTISIINTTTTTTTNAFSAHIYSKHHQQRCSSILHPIKRRQQQQRQSLRLQSSNSNSNSNDNNIESLKKQAEKIRLEAEQMEALLTLEKINNLESRLKKMTSSSTKAKNEGDRDGIRKDVLTLWQKVDPNGANQAGILLSSGDDSSSPSSSGSSNSISPSPSRSGLSPLALKTASDAFLVLSPSIQIALAKAVEMDISESSVVNSKDNINAVVNRLYMERDNLTAEQLQREYQSTILSGTGTGTASYDEEQDSDEPLLSTATSATSLPNLPNFDSPEAKRIRFVESALPQLTRPEDTSLTPTLEDAQLFLNEVLLPTLTTYRSSGKSQQVFNPTAPPEDIPGGFIFRGTLLNSSSSNKEKDEGNNDNNKENKNSNEMMITLLDEAMSRQPTLSNYQYYFIKDPTPEALEDAQDFFGQPVIFLSTRNLTPTTTSTTLLSLVTLSSLFLIILFSIGTFAGNNVIMERFQSDNALGNYDADWFNVLLAPMVLGVLGVQAAHELGHALMAKIYNVKLTPPTLLPSVFSVPHLGCVTSVKTSPKDYTALYDIAMAGPLLGMLGSALCLALGLYLTLEGDAESVKYFPSLGGNVVGSSRLGAAIVDGVLGYGDMMAGIVGGGGGQGAGAGGAAVESVVLHPLAVAGFASLYVNALNLLPLGNTDGGRIAQTLFNRTGHTVIQGLTYLILFGVSLFGGDQTNIFLAYTLLCLFAQNDLEIPCRDEVTVVDFGRSALAIVMWLLAVLVLVPV